MPLFHAGSKGGAGEDFGEHDLNEDEMAMILGTTPVFGSLPRRVAIFR